MWFSAICLGIFLPCVFSRDLPTRGLQQAALQQLQDLQKLTNELEAQGNYNIPSAKATTVNIEELFLHVFTRTDLIGRNVSFLEGKSIAELTSFDISHKTFIYIHGWLDTVDTEGTVLVKDSLLEAADLNVIILDWDKYANTINYLTSWESVEAIGNFLGRFLTVISETYDYSLDDVTLVGHSLGAHISGYAGKYNNRTIGAIVGLDPAGPLFFEGLKDNRLDEADAQFVQAIHTSSFFLGVQYNVGQVDFWPNGGYKQAGCGLDLAGQCAHIRAAEYYAESIIYDDFVGTLCSNYDSFENGECNGGRQSRMGGLVLDRSYFAILTTGVFAPSLAKLMSWQLHRACYKVKMAQIRINTIFTARRHHDDYTLYRQIFRIEGDYYLTTNEVSPFGKGDV